MTRQIEKLRSYRLKRVRGYKTKDLSAFAMPYLEEGREASLSPDGEVASLLPPRDQVMSVEARRAQYRAGRQLSAPPKMEIKQVYGRPTTPQDKADKTSPKSPSNKKRGPGGSAVKQDLNKEAVLRQRSRTMSGQNNGAERPFFL
uniref:Uncharacterized protein n=1 Tax=Branchiostoma floridae TaxID=7739 RepID=C3YBW0_BRAFL|eukprot:XP_002606212.1 hypothetical protein BRAFLDRAFT_105006 [Branchiostoma floridae]